MQIIEGRTDLLFIFFKGIIIKTSEKKIINSLMENSIIKAGNFTFFFIQVVRLDCLPRVGKVAFAFLALVLLVKALSFDVLWVKDKDFSFEILMASTGRVNCA